VLMSSSWSTRTSPRPSCARISTNQLRVLVGVQPEGAEDHSAGAARTDDAPDGIEATRIDAGAAWQHDMTAVQPSTSLHSHSRPP
jgi:hypothetical protein